MEEQSLKQRWSDTLGVLLIVFWVAVGGFFGINIGRKFRLKSVDADYYVQSVGEFLPIAILITLCIGSFIWWFSQNEVAYNPETSFSEALKNTLKSGVGICLILAFIITVILPFSALIFPDLYPLWD